MWFQHNTIRKKGSIKGYQWNDLFAVGAWFVWKWRNLIIHDPDFKVHDNAAILVCQQLDHYKRKWNE